MSEISQPEVSKPRRGRASLPFDRWRPSYNYSLAYYLFRQDLRSLNSFTWHTQGTINNAEYMLHKIGESEQIKPILNYGHDPGNRSDTIVRDARVHFKDAENWTRLATVILTASALELFVRRLVSLSLRSDPGLLISNPRAVEGVTTLKKGTGLELSEHVKSCSEGTWSNRAAGVSKILGEPIDILDDNVRNLQFIQDLRNSIAHEFGRKSDLKDIWYIDPKLAEITPISRLSSDKLQNLLRVVGEVALEIENKFSGHIGSFEMILFWKLFQDQKGNSKSPVLERYAKLFSEGGSEKLLSSYHYTVTGSTLGRKFCKGLITHFNSA